MWFVKKEKGIDPAAGEPTNIVISSRGEIGRCRRHAPTMNGFPVVWQGDWCGDHKLDEQKA